MELNQKEKELIKFLVKKEYEGFKKEEAEIRPELNFLELEERYELFLEKLLEKLR